MKGKKPNSPKIASRESVSQFCNDKLECAGTATGDAWIIKARGVLADAGLFDAEYFGFLPREAELNHPQQRFMIDAHDPSK
ncbi:MAG: hypothetical protein WA419_00545 [Silvibacterium sp.]